ncbi:MAG: FAD-dependent oxidoreductase [Aestuariivirgaceae bacterium]|nr:FAD-dependent oxidoreductase [Aestuariivirgaceae bacterium]
MQVESGAFDGNMWTLSTPVGPIRARMVINAGGLYGDVIDRMLLGETDFEIRPRKGQFVVFDKPASGLVRHILLPVPSATTKGVVVCRTIFGNLLVGPTAEEQSARDVAELVPETLEALRQRGAEMLPGLAGMEVTAIYAGLRPASQFKDYRIKRHEGRNFITIGAIRSTGLTASLGIARHVFDLYAESLATPPVALSEPVWPAVPNLAEYRQRAWQRAGHGGIVCHCERVARSEIEAALAGPIPVQSAGGLKRRTRSMLGRCQCFYCMA